MGRLAVVSGADRILPLGWIGSLRSRVIVRPWRVFRSWSGTMLLVLCAVVAVLLVVFVAQNFIVVEVRLLRWEIDIRLSWALVAASLLGMTVGIIITRVLSR